MSEQLSIEIDCAPGTMRPDGHFSNMCGQLGISEMWFHSPSKFFGNWEWVVKESHRSDYKSKQDQIETYLTALYKNGYIRYASW
jgi:hypothetical protein